MQSGRPIFYTDDLLRRNIKDELLKFEIGYGYCKNDFFRCTILPGM